MKRTLLPLALSCLLFAACKKDQAGNEKASVNPADAKAFTAAITVYHSSKITGTVPAANGADAPVLNASSDNQQIMALNGRYAVIKPEVASGAVAGYYLKVNGADFYYKIDFSKPRAAANRQIAPAKKPHNRFLAPHFYGNTSRADSAQPGYADSSIIIQLPANIAPGTFCAQYCVYDDQGQVSNTINVCVTIDQLGGGKDGAGFIGTWKQTSEKYSANTQDTGWHVLTYQKEYNTTGYFSCIDNRLSPADSTNDSVSVRAPLYYSWTKQADLTFAADGSSLFLNEYEEGDLDINESSCSNLVYHAWYSDKANDPGGWSYNSSTKKLVVVFDLDGSGGQDPQGYEYTVTEQTASHFTLFDEVNRNGFEFSKK